MCNPDITAQTKSNLDSLTNSGYDVLEVARIADREEHNLEVILRALVTAMVIHLSTQNSISQYPRQIQPFKAWVTELYLEADELQWIFSGDALIQMFDRRLKFRTHREEILVFFVFLKRREQVGALNSTFDRFELNAVFVV
jgi:hypothetical protein